MKHDHNAVWNVGSPSYTRHVTVQGGDFDAVVARARDELKKEGFGVLTEIDMKATLKQKLDVDVPRYLILGACNPPLAHQAVMAEPGIGALLPCNVMIAEQDGSVFVGAIDPRAMFSVVGRADVAPIAEEVAARLDRVLVGISRQGAGG